MPESEQLAGFAATRATLAIHLAIHRLEAIVAELVPFYGADCPVAVVVRASWSDERILRGTLGDIAGQGPPPIRLNAPRLSWLDGRSRQRIFATGAALRPGLSPPLPVEERRDKSRRVGHGASCAVPPWIAQRPRKRVGTLRFAHSTGTAHTNLP